MFRLNCSLQQSHLVRGFDFNNYITNFTRYQNIRWKRKPRWLPMAKSRLYRIPAHPPVIPEENEERKRLWNIYRTEMKSIKQYYKDKVYKMTVSQEHLEELEKLEEDEHQRCKQLNEEWNKKIGVERELAMEKKKNEEIERIINELEEKRLAEEERKEEIEKLVRLEKENVKTFITQQNIDVTIEEVLKNEVDFNYSIDLKGNKFEGRRAKPPSATSETKKDIKIKETSVQSNT